MLPRNQLANAANQKRKRTASQTREAAQPPPSKWAISDEELKDISERIKSAFGWTDKEPHDFQIEAGRAQCRGRDVIIHARTGMGKTTVVAAPYAFSQNKDRVTIFVSPLIALQEEMVETFKVEFNLKAIAVNSTRKKSLSDIMEEICAGDHQVVLISPEMLQSREFVNSVLRNTAFTKRVLSMVVDEAHCISHWGADFRKKYGSLGSVRAFLPKTTAVVAMSATFTPRVRRDVLSKLHFGDNYISLDLGNNRANVSLVVRAMHRVQSTFRDLDFMVPNGVQTPADIPLSFLYIDDTTLGPKAIDHLVSLLPESLRDEGLIRPFNANHSADYRKAAMDHFRHGSVRILVCTDAAGMGCNLPNIEVVVQWGLPEKLSSFVQRAGRAARRPGLTGLGVLLVEPTAYGVYPDSIQEALQATVASKGKKKHAASKAKRPPAGWAAQHGRNRGSSSSEQTNKINRAIKLLVSEESGDEGLLVLVQTGDCRRRVIADAFHSGETTADVPCCDLCNPELLQRTLPGGSKPKKGKSTTKVDPADDIVSACRAWRCKVYKEDWEGSVFGPSGILGDTLITKIAMTQEPQSEREFKALVSEEWDWWDDYGRELYACVADAYDARSDDSAPAPAHQPKAPPPRDRGAARAQQSEVPAAGSSTMETASALAAPPAKRPRTEAAATAQPSPPQNRVSATVPTPSTSGPGVVPPTRSQSSSVGTSQQLRQPHRAANGLWYTHDRAGNELVYLYHRERGWEWVPTAQRQSPRGSGDTAPSSAPQGATARGQPAQRGVADSRGRGHGRGRGRGG